MASPPSCDRCAVKARIHCLPYRRVYMLTLLLKGGQAVKASRLRYSSYLNVIDTSYSSAVKLLKCDLEASGREFTTSHKAKWKRGYPNLIGDALPWQARGQGARAMSMTRAGPGRADS